MKKIPFYNPASPLFFHIVVALLYILIFALFFGFLGLLEFLVESIFYFSVIYPVFTLATAIIVRETYIRNYQKPVPEEFANKLVFYNRFLISVLYIFFLSLILVLFSGVDYPIFVLILFLIATGPWFFTCLFFLPIIIRLTLLKKTNFIFTMVALGIIFFLSFYIKIKLSSLI